MPSLTRLTIVLYVTPSLSVPIGFPEQAQGTQAGVAVASASNRVRRMAAIVRLILLDEITPPACRGKYAVCD